MRRLRSPPLFIIFSLLLPLAFCNSDFLIRTARDGINGHDVGVNIEWLTDAQLSELSEVEGQETRMEKLRQFFDAMEPGTARTEAAAKIWVDCYEWLKDVATEEEQNELKQLHHTDHSKCKQKVAELLDRLEPEKKATIQGRMPFCEHVWYSSHKKHGNEGSSSSSQQQEGEAEANDGEHQGHHHHQHQKKKRWIHRHRRDHHEGHEGHEAHHGGHTLDDYFKTHLSWLSDAQKEELKTLKAEGKSRSDLQQKVMDWIGQMEGDEKEKATEALRGGCRELIKAIFGEEKAGEIRKMKEAGTEPEKMNAKIQEWIAGLEDGHKKQMATEYGPTCRKLFGVKSAQRRMRRSRHGHRHRPREEEDYGESYGNSQSDSGRDDEVQLEDNGRGYENGEGGDNEELGHEHLDRHRSWLNGRQKKLLKGMRARGHASHELHDKIHQFYEVSPDEVKATARGILQRGCEAILKRLFGDYKAEEIIQAREEGASNAEMDEKIDEALAQIRNPAKRDEAGRFAMTCRRIFSMIERRRREVTPTEKTLDELFKSHLSWLTPAQKEELKQLQEQGTGRSEMQQKIMGWFAELQGQSRDQALEHLRDGCREVLVNVLGEQNADELKRMKEEGITGEQLEAKADEMVGALDDDQKKAKAKQFGPACKQIFMMAAAESRSGRDVQSDEEN